jgi:hypothetical protein
MMWWGKFKSIISLADTNLIKSFELKNSRVLAKDEDSSIVPADSQFLPGPEDV